MPHTPYTAAAAVQLGKEPSYEHRFAKFPFMSTASRNALTEKSDIAE